MLKISKKILSVLLTVFILTGVLSVLALAEPKDTELKFNDDGKFTILNFSDIQDGYPLMSITKDYLEDTLIKVQPDLVVLTGDNITGSSCGTTAIARAAINGFMSIFQKYGVKVAAVFGNHDDENTLCTKEKQMEIYESYSCFIGYDEGEALPGCGTYNLPIKASDGNGYAFNLWFTDSGTYNTENDLGGYACTTKEQIEWYKTTSAELKAQNDGKPVYSINFQHIVVPEIFDALKEVPANTDGAVSKNNSYWVLPEGATGVMEEGPCPPNYTNGQFDAYVSGGDVLATVAGHDHINTYIVEYKGLKIINTPSSGFASYDSDVVGSRVFVIDENNPTAFETYCLDYTDVYGDNEAAGYRFLAYSDTTDSMTKFVNWFKYIFAAIKELFTIK